MFQQKLQTGAEVQEQNVKAMQGIFDAFWTEAGKVSGKVSGTAPGPAPDASAAGPRKAAPRRRPEPKAG